MKQNIRSSIEPLEARIAPAVFTVTTIADAGAGSLRQALADADSHAGADTVVFHLPAPPLHSENIITLASGLTSTGNVSIKGPGAGNLIISGNSSVRVLLITDGSATSNSPVTISGLTIVDGKSSGNGGGIFSYESLTLKSATISGCTAANGGGVDVGHDISAHIKVNITNSNISGNFASSVGGGLNLYYLDALKMTNTTVSGNTAAQRGGGGAYAELNSTGSGMLISHCVFNGNFADHGAGLFVNSYATNPKARVIVSASVISGNAAFGNTSGGGGLYVEHGNAVVAGSDISGNTSNNNGGGINAKNTNSLVISKCLISGNSTANVGAGFNIYDINSLGISGSVITGNHDKSTVHGAGGGYAELNNGSAGITITGCRFTGNTAHHGAGLFVNSYSTDPNVKITISGSVISGNAATASGVAGGGGLYVERGVAVVTGCTISENTATGYNGGGIEANGFTALSISKSTISGNQADQSTAKAYLGGGGLYLKGRGTTPTGSTVTIASTQIAGNYCGTNGGALMARDGISLTISKSTVSGNHAFLGGGGVRTYGTGVNAVNLAINGSKISLNAANGTVNENGGGISATGSGTISIASSFVTGNSADSDGAGLYVVGASSLTIDKTAFSNNFCFANGAGIFLDNVPTFSVTKSPITANSAEVNGGGVFVENSTGSITGSIIAGNVATVAGGILESSSNVTLEIAKVFGNAAPVDPDIFGTFTFV